MKIIRFLVALLAVLIAVGCTPNQETETPTVERPTLQATAVVEVTDTVMAPTATSEITATVEIMGTDTPISVTPTNEVLPTATAEPTATLNQPLSLPTGQIVFLWDPNYVPVEGGSPNEPANNLYIASPGTTPEQWDVQPVLTELYGFPHFRVSPDQREIALTILEDTNGDTLFDPRRGIDIENIYTYTFDSGSLTRLTNNERNPSHFNWLAERRGIVYEQRFNLFWARLDGSLSQQLTSNPTSPAVEGTEYSLITNLATSPDGHIVALNIQSGTGSPTGGIRGYANSIAFFELNSLEMTIIYYDADSPLLDMTSLNWSPNGRWFAFISHTGRNLSIVERETLTITPLVEGLTPSYPAWSPDSHQLAFWQDSSLMLWDTETQTSLELTNTRPVGHILWSPDGSQIAVAFLEEEQAGILLITVADNTQKRLYLNTVPTLSSWSPDGEWLTFVSEQAEVSGLYVVNVGNESVYQVIDSNGIVPPYDVVWLSTE